MRARLMLVYPLNYIHLLRNLVRIQRVEGRFMSLEFSHVLVVCLALIFRLLEDNHTTAPVSHCQHLPVFIESNGRKKILLCDILWVSFSQHVHCKLGNRFLLS